jgi:hypothetical protein
MEFEPIINKLVQNIHRKNTQPIYLDLVLDSGAFSGSYLVGGLLYLKKLEKLNIVVVKRISGSSIGSLLGLLYLFDNLDIAIDVYKSVKTFFSTNGNVSIIKNIVHDLVQNVHMDKINSLSDSLFISYFDVSILEHVVVSKYPDKTILVDSILSSSYIPFITDGDLIFKNKYIDGIYPYFFDDLEHNRIFFMDLWSHYSFQMLYVKNEENSSSRILEGILETHHLFFNDFFHNTFCNKSKLCNFYDSMNYFDKIKIKLRIYLVHVFVYFYAILIYFLKFYGFEKDEYFNTVDIHHSWFNSFKIFFQHSFKVFVKYVLT